MFFMPNEVAIVAGPRARPVRRPLLAFLAPLLMFSVWGVQAAGPIPDENILARLVWTTMVTLDNANRTGNYEVFYALCSPDFQQRNSLADVEEQFRGLREARVDVGRALMLEPSYHLVPHFTDRGLLRLRGGFEYRPSALRFDLLFTQEAEGWRIVAISVAEMAASKR